MQLPDNFGHGGCECLQRIVRRNCPVFANGLEELRQLIKPNHVAPSNATDTLRWYCEIIDVLKN